ncbi:hypothetical protein J4466_03910 [Candidatus Pacearchaeota archaeon]|nr:hypothetical protein [Candidatus Pacearchaeota archaeon]
MEDKPQQALEKIEVSIKLLIQYIDESLIQINKFDREETKWKKDKPNFELTSTKS